MDLASVHPVQFVNLSQHSNQQYDGISTKIVPNKEWPWTFKFKYRRVHYSLRHSQKAGSISMKSTYAIDGEIFWECHKEMTLFR